MRSMIILRSRTQYMKSLVFISLIEAFISYHLVSMTHLKEERWIRSFDISNTDFKKKKKRFEGCLTCVNRPFFDNDFVSLWIALKATDMKISPSSKNSIYWDV
eukprot:GHVP01013964.1.p1 GENE.GHVP01013964.1~~GHVP01013964.1.p1  ORF type:complete len:103 (+),score=10.69 GHVP01013964.1:370-678(+)